MTPEFLDQLIKLFPNNYELGNVIRAFWHMKRDKPNASVIDLENEILRNFQNNI
jgi:hypothetical protein